MNRIARAIVDRIEKEVLHDEDRRSTEDLYKERKESRSETCTFGKVDE